MSWDSVPWFVGGGAEHSPEVARLLAYAAVGGAEGIVSPGDLKVAPAAVPGASIRVYAGAGLILNRAAGGDQQTYVARNPTTDYVPIASTGSSGGRSDLIVAQIEDPNMPGEPWDEPADPAKGPYVFTRVIPNVPAGTRRLQDVPGYEGRSALTLARIDLPASTGTVTWAMVTDLRNLARPRSERTVLAGAPAAGSNLTSASFVRYPSYAPTVAIPAWATHVSIIASIDSIRHTTVTAGEVRVRLGAGLTSSGREFDLEAEDYAVTNLRIVSGGAVGSMAGTTQTIALDGKRAGGAGYLQTRPTTQVTYDLYFEERAV